MMLYIVLSDIEPVQSTQFFYYIFLLRCILKYVVSRKNREYRSAEVKF